MSELKDLAGKISTMQAKNRKFHEIQEKKAKKLVKELEDGLRKLPQFKGDCPICHKPCVVFGSYDYDWDNMDAAKNYSNCLIGGNKVMYHDACFFAEYGHLD